MSALHRKSLLSRRAVVERSGPTRKAYLDLIARERDSGVHRRCSMRKPRSRFRRLGRGQGGHQVGRAMNIGIVTAYNDMLSAHHPTAATLSR